MFLIKYGLVPGGGNSRADLPLEVETWIMPVEICLARIREEASDK